MKTLMINLYDIIAVAVIFIVVFLVGNALYNLGQQEKHNHVIIEYKYANGVKSYTNEYCLTDSMQVTNTGRHISTHGSRAYFNQ